jgi:hypothetical protein
LQGQTVLISDCNLKSRPKYYNIVPDVGLSGLIFTCPRSDYRDTYNIPYGVVFDIRQRLELRAVSRDVLQNSIMLNMGSNVYADEMTSDPEASDASD